MTATQTATTEAPRRTRAKKTVAAAPAVAPAAPAPAKKKAKAKKVAAAKKAAAPATMPKGVYLNKANGKYEVSIFWGGYSTVAEAVKARAYALEAKTTYKAEQSSD